MQKTNIEEKLESAVAIRNSLIKYRKRLGEGLDRILKEAKEFDEVWEDSIRTLNQYRLLNDIRIGKIIPIVADTGEVANVSFS